VLSLLQDSIGFAFSAPAFAFAFSLQASILNWVFSRMLFFLLDTLYNQMLNIHSSGNLDYKYLRPSLLKLRKILNTVDEQLQAILK
jgi:hypothetical protein